MQPVTIDDRKKELRTLLDAVRARPSHDWSHARQRIVVLKQMIAEHRKAA